MFTKYENTIENCKILAALHEDTDKGWIWLSLDSRFSSRMTIKVLRGKASVYCEYRQIDDNFVTIYNRSGLTKHIDPQNFSDVVVISDWYRKALGEFGTGAPDITLRVQKPRWALWADLRAACQHPEPGARVATRVAIWGTWLGFAGLLAVALEMEPLKTWLACYLQYPLLSTWVPAIVGFALLCWTGSRGVKPR